MSDLIWEQSTDASDDPADSVADLQSDLAALNQVLLDLPQQAGKRALAVPGFEDITPWEGAFSTSPGEMMRAYDLLDPYEAEPSPIAEPFVLEETYDVAQPLALAETYEAFQFEPLVEVEPLALVEPLVEVEPLMAVEPATTYPAIVPAPAVTSWDQLGAPALVVVEPEPELPPRLEGRQAANVLAELGFLDD